MENIREKIDKRDEELEARFLLGMKGKRNIVVVGVNPSTATIDNLDISLSFSVRSVISSARTMIASRPLYRYLFVLVCT